MADVLPKDWSLHETPQCRTIYARNTFGDTTCIATVYCSAGYGVDRHARLIVAAPDLLEACKEAAYRLSKAGLEHLVVMDQLEAAIAKAEGWEP